MIVECRLGPHYCPFEEWTPHQGRVFDGLFAVDTETLLIDDENPHIVPPLVLATACDGRRGFFLARDAVAPFFEAHRDGVLIAHNAAFDLKVLQQVVGDRLRSLCPGRARPGLGYPGAQAAAGAGDRGAYRAGRARRWRTACASHPRARTPQGTPR